MSVPEIHWRRAASGGVLFAVLAVTVVACTSTHPPVPAAAGRPSSVSSPTPTGPPAPVPAVALPSGAPVCGAHLAFIGPLTGSAGPFGTTMEQGAQLAVDLYNKAHAGCGVNLVRLDSTGDPAQAPGLAQQAVADPQVVGVIGPALSGETETAVPVLERAGLAMITPSATRSTLSGHGWRVFHRAVPTDDAQGPAAGHYILDVLHADTVFVLDDGSAYGVTLTDGVRRVLGHAVAGTDRVRQGGGFTTSVGKIKASGATVVYYGGFYDTAGALLNQLRTAGVTATLVGGDGVNDGGFTTAAGATSPEGTVITSVVSPATDPGFIGAFRSANGTGPGDYSGVAFDMTNLYLLGIGHGVGTRAGMLGFVNGYAGKGVSGSYRFTGTGDLDPATASVGLYVYRYGQFTYERSEPGQ